LVFTEKALGGGGARDPKGLLHTDWIGGLGSPDIAALDVFSSIRAMFRL
jgi:hypothetical protein